MNISMSSALEKGWSDSQHWPMEAAIPDQAFGREGHFSLQWRRGRVWGAGEGEGDVRLLV